MLHRAVGACKESERRGSAFTPKSRSVHFLYRRRNKPISVSATEPYHPRRHLCHAKIAARDGKMRLRPTRTAARDARTRVKEPEDTAAGVIGGDFAGSHAVDRRPGGHRMVVGHEGSGVAGDVEPGVVVKLEAREVLGAKRRRPEHRLRDRIEHEAA